MESATRDWINAGTDASFLYGGGRLELAEAWVTGSRFALGEDERRFLMASRENVNRDRLARSRRRRRVTVLLATAAVVAITLAAIAFVQRRNADRQADERRSGELAGMATLAIDEDPERAILLALAATQKSDQPSSEVISALHRATQSARLTRRIEGVVTGSMDLSPDGSTVAVDRVDRTGYQLIDTASGRTVADVTTSLGVVDWFAFAFDPSGSTLAVAVANSDGSNSAIELYDVGSSRLVTSLTGGPDDSYCCTIQFDPTGRWLGALGGAHGATVWDLANRGEPRSFQTTYDFEFGVDGTSIVAGNESGADGLRDRHRPAASSDRHTPRRGVRRPRTRPDGALRRTPLPGGLAARVDVIDMQTGEVLKTLEFRDPSFAQFSRDGRRLAVAGNDGVIYIYDTDVFAEQERLVGTSGAPIQIIFDPDGARLVSAKSGEVRIWDISAVGRNELGNFHIAGDLVDRLVVAADESTAYATTYTNFGDISAVHRVDIDSGKDDEVLGDVRYFFSTRPLVSPDSTVIATPDQDFVTSVVRLPDGGSTRLARCDSVRAFDQAGRVAAVDAFLVCAERGQDPSGASRILDLHTGNTLLDLGDTPIYAAAFGPPEDDGLPRLAVVEEAGTWVLTMYDLVTGEAIGTYAPDADRVNSLAMALDGKRLAMLMDSGRLVVLDTSRIGDGDNQKGATVFDIVAHAAGSKAVAFSSSGMIATGSSADGLKIWSPEGDLLASVPTHQDDDPTFAFAPGTDTLYYEDGQGIVRRFAVDMDDAIRLARSVLTRALTPQECSRYFPDERCPKLDT